MTEDYVIDSDTLGSMGDYFLSAIRGDENKTRLLELWKTNLSVATSRPLSEEIRKAREGVLDELIEHYEQVIKDGSGITYNHSIIYEWMYRGIVVDYLKLLREGAP